MQQFNPRDYQEDSVSGLFSYFEKRIGNPLLVLPTGAGKSVVQAMFIKRAVEQHPHTRFLVASHVKELLEQNAQKIVAMCPKLDIQFCSAGIGEKRFGGQVLVAGIQTAYKHADRIGHADLMIVDESHLISEKSQSMYQTFIKDLTKINPYLKVIGMTATPYRLSSGMLYGPDDDTLFSGVAHEVPIRKLVDDGYLTRLVGYNGGTSLDLSNLHTRGGDFIDSEMQELFDKDDVTAAIVDEVIGVSGGCKGILVFASGVDHAHHLAKAINAITGERVEVVSGTTPRDERTAIIQGFKNKEYRWLCNYGVLTTGFDAPHVDMIVLCRATQSTGLYMQILGRGMRIEDGKTKCVVMDYGRNIERHGPVDRVKPNLPGKGKGEGEAPIKECPQCMALLYTAIRICPECEFEFPEPKPDLARTASGAALWSDEVKAPEPQWHCVSQVEYTRHKKQGGTNSMKVTYHISPMFSVSEWVCFDHGGYARRQAEQWSERRKIPAPGSVTEALLIEWPGVCKIKSVQDGNFQKIVDYEWGSVPCVAYDCDDIEETKEEGVTHKLREDRKAPFAIDWDKLNARVAESKKPPPFDDTPLDDEVWDGKDIIDCPF